jgi:hypothetical protein
MSAPDPVLIRLGARDVPVKWTNRARFRLSDLPRPPTLEHLPREKQLAFLIAHLWAALADDADRRLWKSPEDLAELVDEKNLGDISTFVFREAYDIDVDAPPVAEPIRTPQSEVRNQAPPEAAPTGEPGAGP